MAAWLVCGRAHTQLCLVLATVFAGVVVRNDANALVAFHAITIQFGANFGRVSMRP